MDYMDNVDYTWMNDAIVRCGYLKILQVLTLLAKDKALVSNEDNLQILKGILKSKQSKAVKCQQIS